MDLTFYSESTLTTGECILLLLCGLLLAAAMLGVLGFCVGLFRRKRALMFGGSGIALSVLLIGALVTAGPSPSTEMAKNFKAAYGITLNKDETSCALAAARGNPCAIIRATEDKRTTIELQKVKDKLIAFKGATALPLKKDE